MNDRPALTDIQRKTLRYVENYIRRYGYSPTLSEIGEGTGDKYRSAVRVKLMALRKKGYVTWVDGSARTVRPLGG